MFIFGHLSVFGYLVICIFERYFVYLSVYSLGGFVVLENVLEDNELGRFLIKVNTRARRLTFRTREDAIYVTIPPGTTLKEIKNAIEELRPRLRVARKKHTHPMIDLNFRIDTEFFKLSLVSGQRERFLSRSELGEMQIICPPGADLLMRNYKHGYVKLSRRLCVVMQRSFFHPVCICFHRNTICLTKV